MPRGRWQFLTGFMSDGARPNRSLFGEILDWLWVPVMLLLPLDLDHLVRERVRESVPAARARQIDLGFDADAGVPVWIAGNAPLLAELVNNLVDNAIRFTPPGGVITVRVQGDAKARATAGAEAGASPALEVEDNGTGIAPGERELVFERFYRVLDAGSAGGHPEGSGLGLAIVREIAIQHHATLRIRAGAGCHGTVFVVEFPAADGASHATADAGQSVA